MRARVDTFDWSKTVLGPKAQWPVELATAVDIALNSRMRMFVWWGPHLINIYNDAYIPVLGKRHPEALGKSARDTWSDVWPAICADVDSVICDGNAVMRDRVRLITERNGFSEEMFISYSYSPIPDGHGGVGGLFQICTDETKRLLAERDRDRMIEQRQLALDSARMGWWHYDPVTKIATYDRRYTEIFGIDGNQRPNDEILQRILPDDLPGLWAKVEAALDPKTEAPYHARFRILRSDGATRWVESHGSATFEGTGEARKATSLVGTIVDITSRMQADENARTILETISDAFFAVDRNWKFTYVNPQADRVLNFKPGELLGRVIWDVFPGLEGSEFGKAYREVAAHGVTAAVTAFYPDHNRWYEVHVYPAPSGGLSIYLRDVTQRKQDEERFRESTALLSAISASTGDVIYAKDLQGRIRYANPATLALIGKPLDQVLGKTDIELLPDKAVAVVVMNNDRQIMDSGNAADLEEEVPTPDGKPRVWSSRKMPDRDASGKVVGLLGVSRDITDKKAREVALRDMADRLERQLRLFERVSSSTPDFIYVFGLDGRFLYANRRLLEVWGTTFDQAVGKSLIELGYPQWHADMHLREIARVIETRQPVIGEVPFTGGSGISGIYEYIFTPVLGPDGEVEVIAGTTRDVSDRKRAEAEREKMMASEREARAEAERASRMKDEFLATLSHELRTPLNAILGWAAILSGGNHTADELHDGLETIQRNARAQTQIIEDLLDMSRIISGKIRLDVQRVDLAAVVQAAVDTVRPAADARGIRVLAVIDSNSGPVSGDPNRLQQVFWNLLTNAVKFTPKGGQIQVVFERVNSHLEVTVADTGEGISPEFLPYVFDRFRQADASTTRRHGGLGLGLSIVKQLVELHGGTVRVKSPGIGKGSTFLVALPLTVAHAEPGAETTDRRHPAAVGTPPTDTQSVPDLSGLRVVVVDDEPDARSLVKRLLENSGAVVRTAGSVDEAVNLISVEQPDVLVSDIGMPGQDGYALIRQVRALSTSKGSDIPAIALTAYARTDDRVRAIRAGFQTHVAKPVEPIELVTLVASLAGRKG